MLFLCVESENRKLRHSVIWLACFLLPLIPAVMGTFNYLQNIDILTGDWYSLWTQFTLFYAVFFYGPLIALYCSYLWRLEHMNHNWNMLMTAPVNVRDIFFGKLYVVLKVTLMTQLWMLLLFILAGTWIRLPGMVPFRILFWTFRGTLAAAAIGALQLLLSMCIRSFAVPIAIALAGGIFGMFWANSGRGLLWPYALMLMGMNSNNYEDQLAGDTWKFLAAVMVYAVIFISAGIWILKNRDVRA